MTERIALPCFSCGKRTEWLRLTDLRFFCHPNVNVQCSMEEEVIHSTRDIRKMPHSMVCPITSDQRCHILGLNAAKVIFNHYALEKCDRIDDETLSALVKSINDKRNYYCCSDGQNDRDKETEKAFLDVFIYKKRAFTELDKEGIRVYTAMLSLLEEIQRRLGSHPSPVIERIRSDFVTIASAIFT